MEGYPTYVNVQRRHLTDDEIVRMAGKDGISRPYRIRVWRGKGATPIVLASPALDEYGLSWPCMLKSKLANYAVSAIAGYPEAHILYFESDQAFPPGTECDLRQVHFEFFGHARRLRLYRPIDAPYSWGKLEEIVGERIER